MLNIRGWNYVLIVETLLKNTEHKRMGTFAV